MAATGTRWKRPVPRPKDSNWPRGRRAPIFFCSTSACRTASGLEVLTRVRQSTPHLQTIVLTGQDTLSNAIDSIKLGAFHFIGKPYAAEELLSLMQRAFEQQQLVRETQKICGRKPRNSRRCSSGRSPSWHRCSRIAGWWKLRSSFLRSLLRKPTCSLPVKARVGKEVVANLLHTRSRRRQGPLVKLNCAALPQHLIEGELFGYVKGAFTGAVQRFSGHDRGFGWRHPVSG